MKGLIDHYIVSLDEIEIELRIEASNKINSRYEKLNFKEVSDEFLDRKIEEIFETYPS